MNDKTDDSPLSEEPMPPPKKEEKAASQPPLPQDMGEFTSYAEGDTLYLSGDIDLHQAAAFRAVAEQHISLVTTPRIDMRRVPFLDSAGLASLLALSRLAKVQNKRLRIVATGSPRRF